MVSSLELKSPAAFLGCVPLNVEPFVPTPKSKIDADFTYGRYPMRTPLLAQPYCIVLSLGGLSGVTRRSVKS